MHACPSGTSRTRQVAAAVIGNALEWYDFIVYGFLSSLIARLFFPSGDEYTSLLMALATFGVGFFMRPVGGVLLGLYADRRGRKAAMQLIILLMTLSIAMIAFAPTYAAIGVCRVSPPAASTPAPRLSWWKARHRTGAVSTVPGNCSASAWRCSPVRGWARWSPIAWTPRPWRAGAGGCRSCSVC